MSFAILANQIVVALEHKNFSDADGQNQEEETTPLRPTKIARHVFRNKCSSSWKEAGTLAFYEQVSKQSKLSPTRKMWAAKPGAGGEQAAVPPPMLSRCAASGIECRVLAVIGECASEKRI